jgi:hypothetical protein
VWWFYGAMADGPISVVSPLAAVLNAAVPVAAGVALGKWQGWNRHGAGNDVGGHDCQRLTSVSFAFVISRNGDLALLSITT